VTSFVYRYDRMLATIFIACVHYSFITNACHPSIDGFPEEGLIYQYLCILFVNYEARRGAACRAQPFGYIG
jgi:hypothetical protein